MFNFFIVNYIYYHSCDICVYLHDYKSLTLCYIRRFIHLHQIDNDLKKFLQLITVCSMHFKLLAFVK